MENAHLVLYTNGLKTQHAAGARILGARRRLSFTISLRMYKTIFQEKMYINLMYQTTQMERNYRNRRIYIVTVW